VPAAVQRARHRGKVVQVDPIKPTLKLPGPKRLKLEHDVLLSSFAFKLNLRRYTAEWLMFRRFVHTGIASFKVRRCRFNR